MGWGMHCTRSRTRPREFGAPLYKASCCQIPWARSDVNGSGALLRFILIPVVTAFLSVPVLARGDSFPFSPNSSPPSSNYFTRAMTPLISPPGFISIMQTNCPKSDTEGNDVYVAFPLTICQTQDMNFMVNVTTETQTAVDHFIWANRWTETGSHNSKPNGVFGQTCRLRYSSKAAADAATEAEASYSAGYGAHDVTGNGFLDLTEAAGIPDANVLAYDDFVANLQSLCTTTFHGFATAPIDTVVLPQEKLADVPTAPRHGITIDWEVQDGHAAAETTAIFATLASIVHGRGLLLTLYTNPLDGAVARYNGVTVTSTDSLLASVDYFDLLLSSRNPNVPNSLTNQVAKFANPIYGKLQIVWDMQNSVADSATIRSAITVVHNFAGVNFWRDRASLGGWCNRPVNQQIGNLLGLTTC